MNKYENNLRKLLGKKVVMRVTPHKTGKLAIRDDNGSYYVLTEDYALYPIINFQQISLYNDLYLRPFYANAKTIEEKLLGIVIDSSKLINMQVTALGLSVKDGYIIVRSLSTDKVSERIEFTEDTPISELYKFVSDALLYKNINKEFIMNCSYKVYKSFNHHPLEYNIVLNWFSSFAEEYKLYLRESIITVLQNHLDDMETEKMEDFLNMTNKLFNFQ